MNREPAATRWMPRVTALLLAMGMAWPAMAAERGWRTLNAQHYRVLSQLSDYETQQWTREFDQFIASMSGVLRLKPQQLPPLTVILFARDRDFVKYKMLGADGRPAKVAGLFSRQQTWSVIGLAKDETSDRLRQTILHEATHWLMSVDETRQPAWFTEGIAELLSTFEYSGKQVNWAKPLAQNLDTLQKQVMMPMRDFLTQTNALMNVPERTELFYAQSWAFMHFLLFSGYAQAPQLLNQFLQVYQTRSAEATVDEVFGANLPAVEQAFKSYVRGSAFRYTSTAAAPQPELPTPVPATPAFVEQALGFLALGTDREELAGAHARKAIELDAAAPGGHEILAYLAVQAKSPEAIATHTSNALARGSRDSDMYILAGNSLAGAGNANQPEALRRRADVYKKAIELDRRRVYPYERLAEALFQVEKPTEEDAKFLQLGLASFPGNDWIRVGFAAVAFRTERRAEGVEAKNRALLPGSTLDDRQRAYATGFLGQLAARELEQKLRAAVDRRDVEAVRELSAQLLAEPALPPAMRTSLENLRNSLPPAVPPR